MVLVGIGCAIQWTHCPVWMLDKLLPVGGRHDRTIRSLRFHLVELVSCLSPEARARFARLLGEARSAQ